MSAGGQASERQRGDVDDRLEEAANVLVLSEAMDPGAQDAYFESLLPGTPASLSVLAVNYTQSPDTWLEEWREHVGSAPADCAIVSVDDSTRSAAAAGGGGGPDRSIRFVENVESPDDLTGLGITVGKYLREWQQNDTLTLVTFDSLTVMLQYVDLQRAFRFLHVMVNRVKSADAVGHYHMDPAAHDDRTVATLSSLFDVVVEYEDGTWDVAASR